MTDLLGFFTITLIASVERVVILFVSLQDASKPKNVE